jgi:hypothetical protein
VYEANQCEVKRERMRCLPPKSMKERARRLFQECILVILEQLNEKVGLRQSGRRDFDGKARGRQRVPYKRNRSESRHNGRDDAFWKKMAGTVSSFRPKVSLGFFGALSALFFFFFFFWWRVRNKTCTSSYTLNPSWSSEGGCTPSLERKGPPRGKGSE